MSDLTQCEQIIDYMKQHGCIEPMSALRDLGVYRLASRISDLRNVRGIAIKTTMIKSGKKHYAQYSLIQ